MNHTPISSRAKVRRNAKRANYDPTIIHEILDAGFLCHIAVATEADPALIPMSYGRIGNTIYLHGARKNRILNALGEGAAASICVSHIDGLVLARSWMHHSLNYRSAVLFGKGRWVKDSTEKVRGLQALMEQVLPDRQFECRPPSQSELKATSVIAFDIEEASAKIRSAPPNDAPEDRDSDIWGGLLPIKLAAGNPIADEVCKEHVSLPESVKHYLGR